MNAAAATRSALGDLVERRARRVGRTEAYKDIAKQIGSSSSWIRKFLAGSNEVKEPRMTLFENIRASYEMLCNRVEQEHQAEMAKISLLKRELDAATEGFVEMVERQTPPRAARGSAESC